MLTKPFRLIPEYRDYVWGGDRLRPGMSPTAEAWIVHEADLVAGGEFDGISLGQLAAEQGEALLGKRAVSAGGGRFPLLIKLLDCAQWLSLQVHPNDAQARELEGAGLFGKTEAWHVLEANPEAQYIAGMQPGVSSENLADAIRSGTIVPLTQYHQASTGDTIFIAPGTIHALGPGLLMYEVQQSSDITYRVYDWGRPQTDKRKLHIEKSLAVTNPEAAPVVRRLPVLRDGECGMLVKSDYFLLEMLNARERSIRLETLGQTFHAITVISGSALLKTADFELKLERFETFVVPAACETYHLEPIDGFVALKASLPLGMSS